MGEGAVRPQPSRGWAQGRGLVGSRGSMPLNGGEPLPAGHLLYSLSWLSLAEPH